MTIHIDFDCFFVSAERTRYAPFRGVAAVVANRNDEAIFGGKALKTSAIVREPLGAFSGACYYDKFDGGDWRSHFMDGVRARGMVVAASYEARSHDIKTGTTLCEALKRCPKLQILPADLPFYMSLSADAAEFLEERVPVVEQYSIDEFFGSLDGFVKENDAERYLRNLQADIYKELRLPATIGAGANKSIAKLAAKSAKPFGVLIVKSADVKAFLSDKPVRALAGIGEKSARVLNRYGVKTLGDAIRSPSLLASFGKRGRDLLRELNGEQIRFEAQERERKQIGISRVFDPIYDRAEALRRLYILCGHLAYNVARRKKEPSGFTFVVGYKVFPCERVKVKVDRPFSEKLLRQIAKETFGAIDKNQSDAINYLAVTASDFNDRFVAGELFSWREDCKNRLVGNALQEARSKYGYGILTYAKAT
ncbi:MAG: hypothetical protein LBO72_10295 [Helicobacteraceae bacterium]|jgi:DNA polymerase-4|nr:hypothetical protein [Helicobacteraceae bacterium]